MVNTDSETGELVPNAFYPQAEINAFDLETGEPDSNTTTVLLRKVRFSIPKELIKRPEDDTKKSCCLNANETFTLSNKEEVINLQEVFDGFAI